MTATAAPPAIAVSGLRKAYGDHIVLDGIDLELPRGSVLALLGPNGAGKTTTVNILSTLVRAEAGSARVAGFDVATNGFAVRGVIGVTGQFSAVDGLLTPRENLLLMGRLHHLDRADRGKRAAVLLDRFELTEAADQPAAALSGGMRRKLDLAMTLVGRPSVVFLDEPTTGLDPRSRRVLWDIVRSLVADGVSVLLTTQYLEEADQLADTVAVLDGGRIVAHGTPAELKRAAPGSEVRLTFADVAALGRAADAFVSGVRDDATLTLAVPSPSDPPSVRAVIDRLERSGAVAEHLEVATPGLDDVFLALTGPDARKVAS
ncbi:MAG: ATP-binding cassette domain-containing protein [Humibacillus sp.]|nr:ATP-binding cassette domain-containing protein [Humibacillus sp.]MDN5780232.1 ATP-binding cassette domain-containing protein [Humibacillus sp.]